MKDFWVTQWFTCKRDAELCVMRMKGHGTKYVKLSGKRGRWKVRGKVPANEIIAL